MHALDAPLETALRRDRLVVVGALALVTLLAWAWVLAGAGMEMREGAMPGMAPPPRDGGYLALMFLMWWIMMLAMMLPSASPMILLFAAVNRKQRQRGGPYAATSAFAAGYLLVWAGFSVGAVILQLVLQQVGLLSPMMVNTSRVARGTTARRRRPLPADAAEIRLPAALPVSCPFPVGALAKRVHRRLAHGDGAWRVLCRLLLVPDASPVRRRDHEPHLDRRAGLAGPAREDRAGQDIGWSAPSVWSCCSRAAGAARSAAER